MTKAWKNVAFITVKRADFLLVLSFYHYQVYDGKKATQVFLVNYFYEIVNMSLIELIGKVFPGN